MWQRPRLRSGVSCYILISVAARCLWWKKACKVTLFVFDT